MRTRTFQVEHNSVPGAEFQEFTCLPKAACHHPIPLAYIVDAIHIILNPLDYVILPLRVRISRGNPAHWTHLVLVSPPMSDELGVPLGRLLQGHQMIPIPAVIARLLDLLGDV